MTVNPTTTDIPGLPAEECGPHCIFKHEPCLCYATTPETGPVYDWENDLALRF